MPKPRYYLNLATTDGKRALVPVSRKTYRKVIRSTAAIMRPMESTLYLAQENNEKSFYVLSAAPSFSG